MLTASPITRQTVGKTFSIAISTLGVGAVLQLGIIGWAFATRPMNPLPNFSAADAPTLAHLDKAPTIVPPAQPDLNADPFPAEPPQTLKTTPEPTVPSKPTPVPQKTPP